MTEYDRLKSNTIVMQKIITDLERSLNEVIDAVDAVDADALPDSIATDAKNALESVKQWRRWKVRERL